MKSTELVFKFNELEVGFFEEDEFPKTPGEYKYQPYRGQGHFELQAAFNSFGVAECTYLENGRLVKISLVKCLNPGKLTIQKINLE